MDLEKNNEPDYDDPTIDNDEGLNDDVENDDAKKAFKDSFTVISKLQEEKPHPCVSDTYYKTVLNNEGEFGKEVHKSLSVFLKAKTNEERNDVKKELIYNIKELYKNIMYKVCDFDLPIEKRFFLRYRMVLPTLLNDEQRKNIATIVWDNEIDEAVWYVDEWIEMVATGKANPLATDEAEGVKATPATKNKSMLEKQEGQHKALEVFMKNQYAENSVSINSLFTSVSVLKNMKTSSLIKDIGENFNDEHIEAILNLYNVSKTLLTSARNYNSNMRKYANEEQSIAELRINASSTPGDAPSAEVVRKIIKKEMKQIDSLFLISVGRNGNPLNFLLSQLVPTQFKEIATRENVVKMMAEIEKIDSEMFIRTFRRQTNRIPPHVILLPCYGNNGACWEPYERSNKATSRGRIAIPMFSKNLRSAVLSALAVYRWESWKAMASHYWMEEGLTGQFYQYFVEQKMKGDVRDFFTENYTLWINSEYEGIQKLDKEVRGIFWRNTPFSDEKREELSKRGFVYDELYKKDFNRKISQG